MERKRKLWDPIIRWSRPLCYVPAIWEIMVNREALDMPALKKLVIDDPFPISDDPVPIKKYFKARIELTKSLIEEKKLDPKIGEMVIKHFETHLKELEGTPVPIPIP